jgi:hypothetical protein
MSADELASWQDMNSQTTSHRTDRPCHDCPVAFAMEMRALGRCNGEPMEERRWGIPYTRARRVKELVPA